MSTSPARARAASRSATRGAALALRERNNVPSLLFVERGFVLDTIEVAVEWDRIHALYAEVVAAMRTVKSLVVISGHLYSYAQGINVYFTFVARPGDPAAAEPTCTSMLAPGDGGDVAGIGGTICHHHGIGRLRAPGWRRSTAPRLDLLRAVKRALDPNGILSPGVLLP
ncbi:MAG: FAD-linked oxidase C-terminal domain-containing protein [Candidatus Binatia bacterium]